MIKAMPDSKSPYSNGYSQILGLCMRKARLARECKAADLVSEIGISAPALSRLENGHQRQPFHLVADFCRTLDVHPATLYIGVLLDSPDIVDDGLKSDFGRLMMLAASALYDELGEEIGDLSDQDIRAMVTTFVQEWRRRRRASAFDDYGFGLSGSTAETRWR